MFKKLLNLSACLATIYAQDAEAEAAPENTAEISWFEGTPQPLATATDGNVVNTGYFGEVFVEQGADMALVTYFGWTTTNAVEFLPAYSWIQSYAQMEDPEKPGNFLTAVCNVGYNPSVEFADVTGTQVLANTFYGPESLTVAAIPEGKYDSYGTEFPEEVPRELLYQIADLENAKRFSGYDTDQVPDVISSQQCTVWAPMYAVEGGKAVLDELNAKYIDDYKNNKEFKVDTGFRIWKRSTKSEYLFSADGGSATVTLTDWSDRIDYDAPIQSSSGSGSGSSSSGGMSGGSSSDGMKGGDDMMMDDEEGGSMMMIIIIVVAVAVVLIIGVIVGFLVMRSKNNKKTEIQLKEGGEVEINSITEE